MPGPQDDGPTRPRIDTPSKRPGGLQAANLLIGHSKQSVQDRVGVLAQQRGVAAYLPRRPRKLCHDARQGEPALARMLMLDHGAAEPQVRVGDQGRAVGHHPGRHPVCLEHLHDLARAPLARPPGHHLVQFLGVGQTQGDRGEPLILERGTIPRCLAESLPLPIVSH